MQTEFMSAIEQIMEGAKKLKDGLGMTPAEATNAAFAIWNDVRMQQRDRELAAEYGEHFPDPAEEPTE